MADKLLEQLADDIVSGLKGFFAHQINNGEDPTTCLQMFLNFLESNKRKNPQLFKEIASKIDSSLFAALKNVNQIASQDDFIATYHKIADRLIEINPEMPYKTDYGRQKGLIESEKKSIKERLITEKKDKKRIVDNEYRRLLSERKQEYKTSGGGKGLKIGAAVCFVLFVLLLLVAMLVPDEEERAGVITQVCIGVGAVGLGVLSHKEGWSIGWIGGGLAGLVGGLLIGWTVAAIFAYGSRHSVFLWLVLGIILTVVYGFKVAAIQLNSEETSAYNTSLDNIEKHFSDREKYEIAQSTVKILTLDEQ